MNEELTKLDAASEFIQWAGNRSLKEIWNECERGDWLIWLAAKINKNPKIVVFAACQCARLSLKHTPKSIKSIKSLQALK